ncbi:MAG: DNA/RNA nuclease SfsA [Vulcanimicrobiota bacterium]
MKRNETFIPAVFLKRNSRFSATVSINGNEEYIHVPNPGRIKELLFPGQKILLKKAEFYPGSPPRKTRYTLMMVPIREGYVSIASSFANNLFEEAIENRKLEEFQNYHIKKREKTVGKSRLDFLLEDEGGEEMYVEVKSVTLVCGETAYFPDAPTKRGSRHLQELARLKKQGKKCAVVFVVQRKDACSFTPNYKTDPELGENLKQAIEAGVNAYAFLSHIDEDWAFITRRIPVVL